MIDVFRTTLWRYQLWGLQGVLQEIHQEGDRLQVSRLGWVSGEQEWEEQVSALQTQEVSGDGDARRLWVSDARVEEISFKDKHFQVSFFYSYHSCSDWLLTAFVETSFWVSFVSVSELMNVIKRFYLLYFFLLIISICCSSAGGAEARQTFSQQTESCSS